MAALLIEEHSVYLKQVAKRKETISGHVDSKQAKAIRVSFLNPVPEKKVE